MMHVRNLCTLQELKWRYRDKPAHRTLTEPEYVTATAVGAWKAVRDAATVVPIAE
jgi:hypothetical protein